MGPSSSSSALEVPDVLVALVATSDTDPAAEGVGAVVLLG